MRECQTCQHDVVSHVAMLEKHQRFWMDLDQQLLFGSGFSERLRHMQERWSATIEGRVGLRPLNERLTQGASVAQAAHTTALITIPPFLQRDGMWVTIQQSQETITPEKRKRQRKKRGGKKMVIQVALGLWPDGTLEILDWHIAGSEDHRAWEVLVQRLWEHGCCPAKGLQLVVRDGSGGRGESFAVVYGPTVQEQRCMFHTCQNVSKKGRRELKGQENQEQRKLLMEHAAAIDHADTAPDAQGR